LPSSETLLSQFASSGAYKRFVDDYVKHDRETIGKMILE